MGLGGGGAQYAPAISPLNPNLRFVGCDMSGWYRSTDGGASWDLLDFFQISTRVDYGFRNGAMCAMAFHPTDPLTVYAWGPQQDSQNNPPQLLVSHDAGATWAVLVAAPPWGAGRVTQVYLDRGNANLMLIGTDAGIYRSVNGGTSFAATTGSSGYVCGFMVDPASAVGSRTIYAGSDAGAFKSTDGGATWAAANAGLPSASLYSLAGAASAAGVRIYAVAQSNNAIYTSLNAVAWTLSSNGDTFSMAVCAENDTSTAYAMNVNDRSIWKTVSGGGAWAKAWNDVSPIGNASLGWIDYDLSFSGWASPNSTLAVSQLDASKLMFTNLGETQGSDDGGATWQESYSNYADVAPRAQGQKWASRGLEVTNAWHYDIDPNNANYHYICYTDIGFAYSDDAGATWHNTARRIVPAVAWNNTFYQIAFDPTPGTLLAAASSLHDIDHSWPLGRAGTGGVLKSVNHGATWTSASTGLPSVPCTSIVYDATAGAYYAAMWTQGVYKSVNGGASWTACAAVAIGTNKDVYSLRLSGGKLYALLAAQKNYTNPGGLFVSANGGTSWANVAGNAAGAGPLYYPTEFEVNPADPNVIFIAAQDAGATTGGLYRTLNGGTSWTHLAMPVGATPYGWGVSIDPGNTNTAYFATENQGLFQTPDNGATWSRVTTLPFASVQRMTFGSNATYITTFGAGVWKQALAGAPSPTPSPSSTPSVTPASTATQTATPTLSSSATCSATPSLSASGSPTSGPTLTVSPTATWSPSPTPTPSGSPSATNGPTPSASPSATPPASPTATASVTATPTASPSITATPSASASATVSPTASPSPSATLTATQSPSFTVSPTPGAGAGALLDAVAAPNPWTSGSATLRVKVSGPVEAVELRLYSAALTCVLARRFDGSALAPGWNSLTVPLDARLANGLYAARVSAPGAARVVKVMLLR